MLTNVLLSSGLSPDSVELLTNFDFPLTLSYSKYQEFSVNYSISFPRQSKGGAISTSTPDLGKTSFFLFFLSLKKKFFQGKNFFFYISEQQLAGGHSWESFPAKSPLQTTSSLHSKMYRQFDIFEFSTPESPPGSGKLFPLSRQDLPDTCMVAWNMPRCFRAGFECQPEKNTKKISKESKP